MENSLILNNNENQGVYKVSAYSPGKILVCGGYLVISPNYSGLVFNTDTYIQCFSKVLDLNNNEVDDKVFNSSSKSSFIIKILSKNFDITYYYAINIFINEKQEVEYRINEILDKNNKDNSMSNKYIYFSILVSLHFFILMNFGGQTENINNIVERISKVFNNDNEGKIKFLNLTIESDYRFYTYNKERYYSEDTSKEGKFSVKTGLGSSSALTSSLVTSLFMFFSLNFSPKGCEFAKDIFEKSNSKNEHTYLIRDSGLNFTSNLALAAYMANNLAQNKIGSGFDVQSCLLGSQIFKRILIPESSLKSILVYQGHSIIVNEEIYYKNYLNLITKYQEEMKIKYFPSSKIFDNKTIKHCLISIECGSDTRIMVPRVMKWAEANKKVETFDDDVFQKINEINNEIIQIFLQEEFKTNDNVFIKLKEKCFELRKNIKILSKACGVEIEPDILTNLMDRLLSMEDIIFAVCPGAGGYDSIFIMGVEKMQGQFKQSVASILEQFNSEENVKAYSIPIEITDSGTYIKIY